MQRILKQLLYDYMFQVINQNNWEVEWACENELNALVENSIEKLSHHDCGDAEMRQHAKTNLLHLLAYMRLDAKRRGLNYLDSLSLTNALTDFKRLWPFKGTYATLKKKSPLYMKDPGFTWYY